jgi:hypothetical protein
VTPADTDVQVMGAPDLTLQDCCERWGVSSRNSVKARAAALGVELRRESSTRTVWPREDVPLGDELHDHLQAGGTLRDFAGALPQQPKPSAPRESALTAAAGSSDALAVALLQLLQRQTPAPQAPDPLARARGMAQAADERLPLTTPELAELVGLDPDEVARLKAGATLYGFRLNRIGARPSKTQPVDRRAWLLTRLTSDAEDPADGVTGVTALPAATAQTGKRAPGFMACIDAEATVMGRLELPRW